MSRKNGRWKVRVLWTAPDGSNTWWTRKFDTKPAVQTWQKGRCRITGGDGYTKHFRQYSTLEVIPPKRGRT